MDHLHLPEKSSGGNELASKVAYLIGVPRTAFSDPDEGKANEGNRLNSHIFDMLDRNKNCQKFRFLCIMRNTMLRSFGKLRKGLKECSALRDLLPEDARKALDELAMIYNVQLYPRSSKESDDVLGYICRINGYLEQFVQNALNQFPEEHRNYLRSAFLMPGGTGKEKVKKISIDFKNHMLHYPFMCYLNINLTIHRGLILSSDGRFLSLLYEEHEDHYEDPSISPVRVGEAREEERQPIPAPPAVNPTQEQIEVFIRDQIDTIVAVDGASVMPEKLRSLLNAQTQPAPFAKILIFAASDVREDWEHTFPPEGGVAYYDLNGDSFSGALLEHCQWRWDWTSPKILISDNTEQIRRFFRDCNESEIDSSAFLILTDTAERQTELDSRDEEDDDGIRASGTLADYLSHESSGTLLRKLVEERLTKSPIADLSTVLREEADRLGTALTELECAELLRDILSWLHCELQPDGRIFLRPVEAAAGN